MEFAWLLFPAAALAAFAVKASTVVVAGLLIATPVAALALQIWLFVKRTEK